MAKRSKIIFLTSIFALMYSCYFIALTPSQKTDSANIKYIQKCSESYLKNFMRVIKLIHKNEGLKIKNKNIFAMLYVNNHPCNEEYITINIEQIFNDTFLNNDLLSTRLLQDPLKNKDLISMNNLQNYQEITKETDVFIFSNLDSGQYAFFTVVQVVQGKNEHDTTCVINTKGILYLCEGKDTNKIKLRSMGYSIQQNIVEGELVGCYKKQEPVPPAPVPPESVPPGPIY